MIPAFGGQQVEVLLQKEADQLRMERSHFHHAVAPDRLLRESSLPQRHALDVHLDRRIGERDMH